MQRHHELQQQFTVPLLEKLRSEFSQKRIASVIRYEVDSFTLSNSESREDGETLLSSHWRKLLIRACNQTPQSEE
jgi:hypothetical protein